MPEMADVAEDAAEYRRILMSMHENQARSRGPRRRRNRLLRPMQRVHLRLRGTPAGRDAISALLDDRCTTVRQWSATHALAWDTAKARTVLEALAANETGRVALDAKVTLRQFDAGHLHLSTDWQP